MSAQNDPTAASLLAAVGRMQLWLDLHPQTVSVAGEIGSHPDFKSDDWDFRLYAMDRKDVEAVLNFARKELEEKKNG